MKTPGTFDYYSTPLYHDLPTYPGRAVPETGGVFLVAICGQQTNAGDYGGFDRVHVMVIQPNEMPAFPHPLAVVRALPGMIEGTHQNSPVRCPPPGPSRPVRGEILRNRDGQLYERQGRQLVQLRSLVSGPGGQVFEFAPPSPILDSPVGGTEAAPFAGPIEGFYEAEDEPAPPAARAVYRPKRTAPVDPACRKLFLDPGQLRLSSLGDFRPQLEPQLKHPDHLRESHHLPCYVQVFEITRPQRVETLASLVCEPGLAYQLCPLDEAVARKLGLADSLRPHARYTQRQPGWLLPGDRVCRLQLVRDPTIEVTSPQVDQAAADAVVQAAAAKPVSEPAESHSRRAIPERYLKPWEFHKTREEVLFDMSANSGGWLGGVLHRMRAWCKRKEFHRWQSLLSGKSPEDQLWTVRPPKWGLEHPPTRDWALRTLAIAGYDSQNMVTEWEIFWRRKGL
jgi:hypothetical protein